MVAGRPRRELFGKYVDGTRRPWRRERATDVLPERADLGADSAMLAVEDADSVLTRALAALPPAQRAVVVLRFTDDLAVEEIATVLRLPAGTVKSRLSRAIAGLREQLDAQHETVATPPAAPAREETS